MSLTKYNPRRSSDDILCSYNKNPLFRNIKSNSKWDVCKIVCLLLRIQCKYSAFLRFPSVINPEYDLFWMLLFKVMFIQIGCSLFAKTQEAQSFKV